MLWGDSAVQIWPMIAEHDSVRTWFGMIFNFRLTLSTATFALSKTDFLVVSSNSCTEEKVKLS